MKTLLNRVKNILIHPNDEWRVIKDEPTTYASIVFRYISILAVIPPAAAVAGRIFFDSNVPNSSLASPVVSLVLPNALWYCMFITNVIITGAVISAIVATAESRWSGLKGLKIAAYSFTPLFAAGFIAVIPHMAWSVNLAILYGIYILYHGIKTLTAIRGMKAAWYAAVSFLAAAVIVGATNMFEYMLESFIAEKIFF